MYGARCLRGDEGAIEQSYSSFAEVLGYTADNALSVHDINTALHSLRTLCSASGPALCGVRQVVTNEPLRPDGWVSVAIC